MGDKCTRFKQIDAVTGKILFDKHPARYSREKENMCTIEGKYFEPTETYMIEAARIMQYIQNNDFTSIEVMFKLYSLYSDFHDLFSSKF